MAPVPQIDAGDEADIDFEIAIPLVYPQATTLYQVGEVNFNNFTNQQAEAELTFLTPLLDGMSLCFRFPPEIMALAIIKASMAASAPLRTRRTASNAALFQFQKSFPSHTVRVT